MLSVRNRPLILAAGAIFLVPLLSAASLRLHALEGIGMVVSPNAASSRRMTVVAEDDAGQPLSGVSVRFRLPAEGSSGHFASGLNSETVMTPADGRATVMGIVWNNQPGRLLLAVSASLGGESAELEVPVEIGPNAARETTIEKPVRAPSSGIRKKWLLMAATVGAAVAVGFVASALSRPATPAAPALQPPLTVSIPPSVGTPSIGISTPGH